MKLNLKDEPKEWRKTTWLTAIALALISSLLRWRRVIETQGWLVIISVLVLVILATVLCPRWFRGYHLFSMRLGFAISQFLGRVLLILFFLFVLTPVGWILRLTGKDALQLKLRETTTYWRQAKDCSPLDRLF
jgi:Saxitoxin biosynthesis operon protein SxtJ